MKRSFKIITIVALFLSLILISSCSTENHKEEDVREANTQLKLESEELNGITIELLLREFANWDGNKELGADIYTLSLDNDKYLLSILPNKDKKQELHWVEMIYFISKTEDAEITSDEVKQMDRLLCILSPYWKENSQWRDSIINKNLPFEESVENWSLKADYYIYQGNKEGVYVKINNLIKTVPQTHQDSNLDKQNKLANEIREALNAPGHPAICTAVYFNSKGELIIEATAYWGNMSKSDREDIIYLIEGLLSQRKEEIGVEGYGQFFSPVGKGLDSFYAK
ncbi:MAG: hypothetical protein ACOXZ6_00875 [Syntrophomonadaceae bacterium]|nr:hypothetical protein [Syntrophomonadaceae bacterium]